MKKEERDKSINNMMSLISDHIYEVIMMSYLINYLITGVY